MEKRLNLMKSENVDVIERLRLVDDLPIILETIVVSQKLFPDLCSVLIDAVPNELYPFYEDVFHTRIVRAEECIKAVAANTQEARLLDIDVGAPLLEIDRVAYSIEEIPVEWRRSHCNTECNHYQNTLK